MREPEFEGADLARWLQEAGRRRAVPYGQDDPLLRRRLRADLQHQVAARIRLTALIATLFVAPAHAATSDAKRPGAHESCREAVGDSRMICVTGEECQKEISSILAACSASKSPACAAARDDMRKTCSRESPWYGTRKCEAALTQVGRRCGD